MPSFPSFFLAGFLYAQTLQAVLDNTDPWWAIVVNSLHWRKVIAVCSLHRFLLLIIPTNIIAQTVSLMQTLTDGHWLLPNLCLPEWYWTYSDLQGFFFFFRAVWKDIKFFFLSFCVSLSFLTLKHLATLQIFLSVISSSSAGSRSDKPSSGPGFISVVLACYFCCIAC